MAPVEFKPSSKTCQVAWTLTQGDAIGEPINISEYPHMTVEVRGGSVQLLGAMVGGEPGFDVVGSDGFPIKGPGLYHVTVNPLWLWPVLQTEAATVRIVATKMGGI